LRSFASPNSSRNTDNDAKDSFSEAKRESEQKQVGTPEASAGYRHHLGYLAQRDSKAAIPDQSTILKSLIVESIRDGKNNSSENSARLSNSFFLTSQVFQKLLFRNLIGRSFIF
jgi:hypothetical protein